MGGGGFKGEGEGQIDAGERNGIMGQGVGQRVQRRGRGRRKGDEGEGVGGREKGRGDKREWRGANEEGEQRGRGRGRWARARGTGAPAKAWRSISAHATANVLANFGGDAGIIPDLLAALLLNAVH